MCTVAVSAPAKINLMLDVTGKRDDGYHTLVTVMQSISLADTLYITPNNSGIITVECDSINIPTDSRNIAYKAAEKFFEYAEISSGVHIKILKKIPSEAGLGGGSADAAAVLVGMNHIFKTKCTNDKLCEIGVKIGADVPFCIVGGTKLCCGIGEEMSDIEPLENCHIVIAKGSKGISTKEAFAEIDRMRFGTSTFDKKYDGTIKSVAETGKNIFEVVTDNQDVLFLKKLFYHSNAVYSAMSGSGSAVFGLFPELENAEKCVQSLTEKNYFSVICHPMSHGVKIL